MDILSAYREVGSYRGAAALCGTTHKTVRRVVEAPEASSAGRPGLAPELLVTARTQRWNPEEFLRTTAAAIERAGFRIGPLERFMFPEACTPVSFHIAVEQLRPVRRPDRSDQVRRQLVDRACASG